MEMGLKSIAGGDHEMESRNIILPEQTVRDIVVSAGFRPLTCPFFEAARKNWSARPKRRVARGSH
jgi:hypothetical protein